MEMTFMFPQEMGNFSGGRVLDNSIIFSKRVCSGGRKMRGGGGLRGKNGEINRFLKL
jgi:hypothetical protein